MLTRSSIRKLPAHKRIILAWDKSMFREQEYRQLNVLLPHIGFVKIGMQLVYGGRAQSEQPAKRTHAYVDNLQGSTMLDAKILDTENTITNTIEEITWWGPVPPKIVTINANVKLPSIVAALETAKKVKGGMLIAGVTALTDHTDSEITEIYGGSAIQVTIRCAAKLAEASSIVGVPAGIVCSGHELHVLEKNPDLHNLIRITPGIRPTGSRPDDQRRTMEPGEAIHAGADYEVIGRPITLADDMVAAAKKFAADMEAAITKVA